ncbi:hypothetical protein CCZ37_14205 [Vibrio qinghaiensis]|uniref:MmcQ/YjbR family DNA-binding protein n=1 Tax=Vibrio qinghaiensis TaxID=2025808 RepID=A0A223N1M4_9VIBR|nr:MULTISPECIES: MmcQ/YjbR family DNA-binding protein [Vibrio]ASU23744.1 hypothetical protein CCZ37_14205 [Vibrio qinghaiensis]
MKMHDIESFLDIFPQVESSYPFGPDAFVFKIRGKMFAYTFQSREESQSREEPFVTLKCTPEDGEVLTSAFSAIRPGYHMNKKHWISVKLNGDVDQMMLEELCGRSYQLVVSKLKKSDREALQALFVQAKLD